MRIFRLFLLVVFPASVFAAELPPIEDLISEKDRKDMGLHKLTAEERQLLREWLEVFVEQDARFAARRYAEQQKVRKKVEEEKRKQDVARVDSVGEQEEEINERSNRFDKSSARIVGQFAGWQGKTRFTLDNGEVWQQRKADSIRRTRTVQNPEVKIVRNFMGFYVMEVPALKVKVPVSRIR